MSQQTKTKPDGVFSAKVDGTVWWYARVAGRVFGDYRDKGEAEACLATEQRRAEARRMTIALESHA